MESSVFIPVVVSNYILQYYMYDKSLIFFSMQNKLLFCVIVYHLCYETVLLMKFIDNIFSMTPLVLHVNYPFVIFPFGLFFILQY